MGGKIPFKIPDGILLLLQKGVGRGKIEDTSVDSGLCILVFIIQPNFLIGSVTYTVLFYKIKP